jgi:hypothetical protein
MAAIINERLKRYAPLTAEAEKEALKEILQEIVLSGLSDAGFFEHALFQGGTSLRIFYNLERFSEDLDFILKKPDPNFKWQPFLNVVNNICKQYGLAPEIIDKSKAGNAVQKMFLKDTSVIKFLNLSFHHYSLQKLVIKFEIDINPPAGSQAEIKFLDFPVAAAVAVQDLSSNFAGKSHALLCRNYIKGRDWYDFLWYVAKGVLPNFSYLSNAIKQQGPWVGQDIQVTPEWYLAALKEKIETINWQEAAKDVAPFLNERERKTLNLWGIPFFQDRLEKLSKGFEK